MELLPWWSPVWRVGSGRQEFSGGLLLGGGVDFVCCSPVDSAKVRSFLQAVWFDGGVACIAPSESSMPIFLVPTIMTLVSAIFPCWRCRRGALTSGYLSVLRAKA
jgi:hypothetical protein